MKTNIVLATDSYKLTHWNQYPRGTEKVYSYFEARPGAKYRDTVFFGLQYIIAEYLAGHVVTTQKIDEAEALAAQHFGNPNIFNRARWDHIVDQHDGRLPVRIKAVPEGTPVPVNNVMMTIENTDPACYWLTNHLETILTHVWYPSTVATQSREAKRICKRYLEETAESAGGLDFMLHDFGYRGVSSVESAGLGGAGHLVNFHGTDTIAAMELLRQYYDADVPAFSVPATEHSVMTAHGADGENWVLSQLLDAYPTGILSIVIDSYDYRKFIKMAGTTFKDRILARDGKVVFRPDSGDPCEVTLEVLELLGEYFGSADGKPGYKILHPQVGVIWGDGIDLEDMERILADITYAGWSAENMVFGMGGGLLQKVNRDIQRFAFKSSYQERGGEGHDIFKEPIDKTKTSKKGRLKLVRLEGAHGSTLTTVGIDDPREDLLETVFEGGQVLKRYSLDEIRARAAL
ncbi:hypothetical protein LCGC14_0164140 [marine sediment metagenome]|uniref:Nicotinamide phosphoribosyltransferase n=1 Tax=marine sediment metagenome TaxID=412755 RepID=A0A0F9UUP7_9ZZZZ